LPSPFLTLLALALPATAVPALAAERVVSADVRRVKGPLNTMFKTCVGAGRANEGLRADWQRQLAYVRKESGFTYLRMHGLLGDDMGSIAKTSRGVPSTGQIREQPELLQTRSPRRAEGETKVRVSGVSPGRYTQTLYQVGYRVNDAYAVYKDLGSPAHLTRAQVQRINAASDGKPIERTSITIRSGGSFDREVALRENDVFPLVLAKRGRP
jgi:beta-xylosidase